MIRLVTVQDASVLVDVLRINREFLAPWQPIRPDGFFTTDGQRRAIEEGLLDYERGVTSPHVILDDDCIVGRVTLSNIVRGPFQSCNRAVNAAGYADDPLPRNRPDLLGHRPGGLREVGAADWYVVRPVAVDCRDRHDDRERVDGRQVVGAGDDQRRTSASLFAADSQIGFDPDHVAGRSPLRARASRVCRRR